MAVFVFPKFPRYLLKFATFVVLGRLNLNLHESFQKPYQWLNSIVLLPLQNLKMIQNPEAGRCSWLRCLMCYKHLATMGHGCHGSSWNPLQDFFKYLQGGAGDRGVQAMGEWRPVWVSRESKTLLPQHFLYGQIQANSQLWQYNHTSAALTKYQKMLQAGWYLPLTQLWWVFTFFSSTEWLSWQFYSGWWTLLIHFFLPCKLGGCWWTLTSPITYSEHWWILLSKVQVRRLRRRADRSRGCFFCPFQNVKCRARTRHVAGFKNLTKHTLDLQKLWGCQSWLKLV